MNAINWKLTTSDVFHTLEEAKLSIDVEEKFWKSGSKLFN